MAVLTVTSFALPQHVPLSVSASLGVATLLTALTMRMYVMQNGKQYATRAVLPDEMSLD